MLFLESLAGMSRNMVLIGVVGTVFAVVLSIFLARSIAVPIKRLSQATQQIKAGAFGTQVETRSKDEVGALATTFNEDEYRDSRAGPAGYSLMAEELRQLSAGLAHEVTESASTGCEFFYACSNAKIPADPKAEQLIEQVDVAK